MGKIIYMSQLSEARGGGLGDGQIVPTLSIPTRLRGGRGLETLDNVPNKDIFFKAPLS